MILSKWSISHQGSLLRKGFEPLSSPARIVYLDDHKLIRESIINTCIKPFFTKIEIIEFVNGLDACAFFRNEICENKKIDIFITDINHPGLNGFELVKAIRRFESDFKSSTRIPIVIISMVDETRYPELITQKIVDGYLTKAAEVEDIIECLEEIL